MTTAASSSSAANPSTLCTIERRGEVLYCMRESDISVLVSRALSEHLQRTVNKVVEVTGEIYSADRPPSFTMNTNRGPMQAIVGTDVQKQYPQYFQNGVDRKITDLDQFQTSVFQSLFQSAGTNLARFKDEGGQVGVLLMVLECIENRPVAQSRLVQTLCYQATLQFTEPYIEPMKVEYKKMQTLEVYQQQIAPQVCANILQSLKSTIFPPMQSSSPANPGNTLSDDERPSVLARHGATFSPQTRQAVEQKIGLLGPNSRILFGHLLSFVSSQLAQLLAEGKEERVEVLQKLKELERIEGFEASIPVQLGALQAYSQLAVKHKVDPRRY